MKVSGHTPVSPEIKAGQAQEKDALRHAQNQTKGIDTQTSVKTSEFMMDKLKARMEKEPEIRADKVAALKAQISKGEYKIDAQKIAGKLILESLQDQGS
ncbi:flagellar biosynthesis anti-sigma factor FlgM [Deltaproteobacteria bacterium TL4]